MYAATRRSPRASALAFALAIAVAGMGAACSKSGAPAGSDASAPAPAEAAADATDAAAAATDAIASGAAEPPPSAKMTMPARLRAEGELGATDVKGLANHNGSQLAYEHDVRVRLAPDQVAGNLGRVRDACNAQKFGACDVLGEQLTAGDLPTGELEMRAAPEAIAGLVQAAAAGGTISQRSTQAEDLAEAVRDNGMRRKRLELQHAKLVEILQTRKGSIDELVDLTERLAQLEAELAGAEQDAAQQQRRIATNKLSLHFETQSVAVATTEPSSRIGIALRGLTDTWDTIIAWMINAFVGALLPFALVFGLAGWLLLKLRRRYGQSAQRRPGASMGSPPPPPSRQPSGEGAACLRCVGLSTETPHFCG